jgi:hypothetical protein
MKTIKQRAEFYEQLLKELDKAIFSLNYGNTLDTHTHITITRFMIREARDRDKKARKGVTL